MSMKRHCVVRRTLALCGLLASLCAGCGKDVSAVPRDNYAIGGSPVGGLPTPRTVTDTGILRDQKSYVAANAGGGPRGADISGDEKAQVQAFADKLLKAALERDVTTILDSFVADHIAALRGDDEKVSEIHNTFGTLQLFETVVKNKLGEAAFEEYKEAATKQFQSRMNVDVIDGNNASISPNLIAEILGPKAGPATMVTKVDGEWKIQLAAPLTDADADAIVAFHKAMQASLATVVSAIERGDVTDLAKVLEAMQQAAPPASGGGAGGPTPGAAAREGRGDSEDGPGAKPTDDAKPTEEQKPAEGEETPKPVTP